MAQFWVYDNKNKATQKRYPYLLDIQSDLLEDLRTTVVIPLTPTKLAGNHVMSRMNPTVEIGSERFVVMTQTLAGVDRAILGESVCSLAGERPQIVAAIDFVFSGI